MGLLFSRRRVPSCRRHAFRAEKEVGASLRPLPCPVGARGAAGVRIRRCLPLRGKSASELARRILAGSRERVFCGGVLPIRKLSRRARETELRGTSHRFCFSRRISGARHTVETVFPLLPPFRARKRPSSRPPRRLIPHHPAGRTAGSARTRPRGQPLGNPFLGDGNRFPRGSRPTTAAGGKPLLVGRACVESEPTAPAGGTAAS